MIHRMRAVTLISIFSLMLLPMVVVAEEDSDEKAGSFNRAVGWVDNLKIYGKLQVSAEIMDDGDNRSAFVSSNSTRIGFKVEQELRRGLDAIWQYEGGIAIDDAANDFETRNSFVGLSGTAGSVFVGRHDTPFERLSREIDLFDERIGDSRNIIGLNGAGFNQRADNMIGYKSPDLAGFKAFLLNKTEDGVDHPPSLRRSHAAQKD